MKENKTRIYYFDNLKLILIILVVFGHMINPLVGRSYFIKCVYDYIYFFHMPLFFLISGVFSKKYTDIDYNRKNIINLIFYYLIFQIIYYFFDSYILKEKNELFSIVLPNGELWFLLSLILMRVLLPYVGRFKRLVFFFFVFWIIIGYFRDIGEYLSLLRTAIFFPFFLAGYHLKKEQIYKLTDRVPLWVAIIGMFAIFVTYYLSKINLIAGWLSARLSFDALGVSNMSGIILRLSIYVISLILCLFVARVIPRSKTIFTHLGERSLYVFLLHPLFVRVFIKYGYHYLDSTKAIYLLVLLLGISLSLVLILSNIKLESLIKYFKILSYKVLKGI